MIRSVRILAGNLSPTAGSHVYHVQLARRLAERGYDVSVFAYEACASLNGVAAVTVVPCRSYADMPLLWRFESFLRARDVAAFIRRCEAPCPNVVIGAEHLSLKPHAARFPGTPWIYLPHSYTLDREIAGYGRPPLATRLMTWQYEAIQKWAIRTANVTVRFSQAGCEAVRQRHSLDDNARFQVNPAGVDLPDFVRQRGDATRPIRLLSVGRVEYLKGIEIAVNALLTMPDLAWEYDIVGDGSLRGELEAKCASAGLSQRVHFHGNQPDPSAFYRQADLLLFPSRLESLGLACLEAMSYGVPSLAIRSDGGEFLNVNHELIEHGKSGFLVNTKEEYAPTLRSLLQTPELIRSAGDDARERVRERFTWKKHLEMYEQIFDEILPTSVPRR